MYKSLLALFLAGLLAACAANPAGEDTADTATGTATSDNAAQATKRCRYSASTSSRLGNRDCKTTN